MGDPALPQRFVTDQSPLIAVCDSCLAVDQLVTGILRRPQQLLDMRRRQLVVVVARGDPITARQMQCGVHRMDATHAPEIRRVGRVDAAARKIDESNAWVGHAEDGIRGGLVTGVAYDEDLDVAVRLIDGGRDGSLGYQLAAVEGRDADGHERGGLTVLLRPADVAAGSRSSQLAPFLDALCPLVHDLGGTGGPDPVGEPVGLEPDRPQPVTANLGARTRARDHSAGHVPLDQCLVEFSHGYAAPAFRADRPPASRTPVRSPAP